ncbi:hypothetical protein BDP55DRAFT_629882 [Colletotrichum godetiae]|uniref:Uncharacterized protein n=1 Tax=Colletotrichum godetiae TaxID=1209918 RepID=A0AAJ0AQ19_9PEZI|nr:uncharacterized protein BDP55DRAFT_629882 [Colletotrichum godetiae]KAK1688282.1 hypothetical protein BDP55DRAFT_629882 [Colletotrichum godetiae]
MSGRAEEERKQVKSEPARPVGSFQVVAPEDPAFPCLPALVHRTEIQPATADVLTRHLTQYGIPERGTFVHILAATNSDSPVFDSAKVVPCAPCAVDDHWPSFAIPASSPGCLDRVTVRVQMSSSFSSQTPKSHEAQSVSMVRHMQDRQSPSIETLLETSHLFHAWIPRLVSLYLTDPLIPNLSQTTTLSSTSLTPPCRPPPSRPRSTACSRCR